MASKISTVVEIDIKRQTQAKLAKADVRTFLAPVLGVVAWVLLYSRLSVFADWLTNSVFHLSSQTRLGSAVQFFAFELPKVLMLLTLVVYGVGIVRSFFTPERTRRILTGQRETSGNVLAALLGVVTPFCSCSAVPLFIGFVTTGIPLGVTFSFLVSAPMVNEVALVLLFGLFGWRIAAIYAGTGLLIAILAGWTIGRLRMEKYVEQWLYGMEGGRGEVPEETVSWNARLRQGQDAVREIVGKVWPYVMAGIAVGAWIHGYVPENFMASIMGKSAWWSVPLAVLIGVPMYSNAAGIIPVVQALLGKGAALGTVLAFMMSVIGLSLPEDHHPSQGTSSSTHCSFCGGGCRWNSYRRLSVQPNHVAQQRGTQLCPFSSITKENQVDIEIKVLGPGCGNCKRLYAEAQKAVDQFGSPATITKVEDIQDIMAYKILATPALVINGEIKSAGRIPNAAEITTWLATAAMSQEAGSAR